MPITHEAAIFQIDRSSDFDMPSPLIDLDLVEPPAGSQAAVAGE
jgi:hypothetical protein